MRALLSDLIAILETQRDTQKALVELSERKTQAIASGDISSLQAVVDEERAVLTQIKALEQRQGQWAAEFAKKAGMQPQDVRMALVIERAEGEQKKTLARLRDELSELIGRQISRNDINMKLLQMNMEYVQFLINATMEQRADPTYGDGGKERKAEASQKRLLDRKV
jgi:flagellar biosynthesis/type III secretory pathway chaperone